jgi:hypothetical protein
MERADVVRSKLGFNFMLVHESDGRSGGLVLFSNKENKIDSLYIGPNFIDVTVGDSGDQQWRFTGFYGEPSWDKRDESWGYIRQLNLEADLPWLLVGDFNEILYAHEKEGGNPRPLAMMQKFRECLSDCGLEDLGYIGDPFTWRRGNQRKTGPCSRQREMVLYVSVCSCYE